MIKLTEGQLIEFYRVNADLLSCNDIFSSAFRSLSWFFVKIFTFLADICQNLYDTTFGLVDFTTWANGNEFLSAFKLAFIGLMAVSLFALGIMLIFSHEKKPKIVQNIVIACLCVTCSATVFSQLNSLTVSFKEGVESIKIEEQSFDGAYDIVSNNLYDLAYLDLKIGMKNINYENNKEKLPHSDLDKEMFSLIDYNEVLNYDTERFDWNSNGNAKEILKQKVTNTGDNFILQDVYNGFGIQSGDEDDLFNEFYYRYKMDFFPTLIMLGALIIVYLAMSYKVIRLILELFVSKLLAYLYSAELSGGQRIGKILVFIRDTYILLLFTTILIRCFYLAVSFCQAKIDNSLVECIIILFIAFVIVDGPNIIESLLGMDVGLSSSTARIFATYHAVRAGIHTATAPARYGLHKAAENSRFEKMTGRNKDSEARNASSTQTEAKDSSFMDSNDNSKTNEVKTEDDRGLEKEASYSSDAGNKDKVSSAGDDKRDISFMNDDTANNISDKKESGHYKNEEKEHGFMEEDLSGRDIARTEKNAAEDMKEKDMKTLKNRNIAADKRSDDSFLESSKKERKSLVKDRKTKFESDILKREKGKDKR